jgi:hypothetical protein
MATARLRAACKVLEVDRGTCGKAGLVIALLTIAPAMAKPIAHHAVFLMALRKPPAASVPWALRASIRHHVRGPVRLQEVPGGLTRKVESGGCVTPVTDVAAERPIVSQPRRPFSGVCRMHRHPTQRRRQDARNAIAYWLDAKTPAERETSEDIRSSIEIDDNESPSLVPEISA